MFERLDFPRCNHKNAGSTFACATRQGTASQQYDDDHYHDATALYLGWTMAELYGHDWRPKTDPPVPAEDLPGIGSFSASQQTEMRLDTIDAWVLCSDVARLTSRTGYARPP